MIGDVKTRLLEVLQLTSLDQLVLQHLDHEITPAKDSCLVGTLDPGFDHQNWVLKNQSTTTTSSSTALVVFNNHQDGKSTPIPSPSSSASTSSGGASRSRDSSMRKSFTMEEGEKCLPGVIMASDVTVFNRLYQIAGSINDNRTLKGIRRLIHLIPTDPSVLDVLEGITYHSDSSPRASADASPKLSPRNPKKLPSKPSANLEEAREQLSILLDANHPTMNPFRVLYNLEVLSGRLMPTRPNSFLKVSSEHFSRQFLDAGGLKMILNILEKNSLPADLDPDIRQSAYHVTLQLVDHLLCGHSTGTPNPTTSPVIKPTPPKRSALDSSVAALVKSPTVLSATKIVQTMAEGEFSEMISRLMRVVWAAAAGKLHLASAGFSVSPNSEHPRFFASRRSRDSSTGSSGSESSFDVQTLHAGVCAQQSIVSSGDCHIAEKAMELLVTCLQLRSTSLSSFYSLPLVNEFIIEILLGSPSAKFRWTACDQLNRLCKIKVAARCLNLDGDSTNSNKSVTPFHFLTKTLLKTPVPLWAPSCRARGLSHTILGQSTQYFSLRCSLLKGLSVLQLDQLEENANSMIEDELLLLQNFSPCRAEDCTLLAGHLRLVEALLSCEGVDKQKVGKCLIPDLLTSFLFPASRLMAEGGLNNLSSSMDTVNNINPKCDTGDSRKAAYDLLVELSRDCPENLILVTTELVKMHHSFNEDILKDFEYEPAVARRGPSNFVGKRYRFI